MKIFPSLATTLFIFLLCSKTFAAYITTGTTSEIIVDGSAATTVYYTAPTDGSSDTNYPAITHNFTGNWNFTFNTDNSVDFTGNVYMGDYETQTNVTGFPVIDGHQQYTGVNHQVSGRGSYDEATNTFSFVLPSGGPNSSIASNQTQTSSSCENGRTSIFGTVCGTWANTTADWEGLTLQFVFSEDRSSFNGTITAIEQSGSGLTANTTSINFLISGATEVPVPAAAWLFAASLLTLIGVKRRNV